MREYLEQGYLQAQVCLCSRDVVDLDVDVDEARIGNVVVVAGANPV